MFEISRRFLLRTAGVVLTGVPALAETHHHPDAPPAEAPATMARFLQPVEFNTLKALCDVIIPADDHSPAAREAGAAEYIDLLAGNNREIAIIFRGGLAWLNARSISRFGEPFTGVSAEQQIALAAEIADLDRAAPELKAGAIFFDWARRMTADAFYTSKVGIQDIGYMGNKASSSFQVPAAVLEEALQRFNQT